MVGVYFYMETFSSCVIESMAEFYCYKTTMNRNCQTLPLDWIKRK